MKWKTKHSRMHDVYWSRRGFVKEHLLFLPVEINGEVRWLERVKIKWKVRHDKSFFLHESYYEWYPYEFIDNRR